MQLVIPEYPNSHPYQQITFQYSLHYIESENGELKHKEFLGVSGEDPRRTLAEQLVADIPENACVLAYNRGFERGRIKELSKFFPDLADRLMKIHTNIQCYLNYKILHTQKTVHKHMKISVHALTQKSHCAINS